MSKASDFIKEHTREDLNTYVTGLADVMPQTNCHPWLSPGIALNAVEIAREEVIEEVINWIEDNITEYCEGENVEFTATHTFNIDIFNQEEFIKELKKVMTNETD